MNADKRRKGRYNLDPERINLAHFRYLSALICVYLCPIVIFVSVSSAQTFTAKTLGDYGNVIVMEVTGNYDANNPDGTVNAAPREAVAKEFFRTHKDEYDFLVTFSNFDFIMPESEARAFYLGVKNDTHGIGRPLFDNSQLFGSNGKLQGTIDMGNISALSVNPADPAFENTLSTLAHEVLHRWGAFVQFKDLSGKTSSALLGQGGDHWSFLLNSYGSVLYGNQWQDNGNGTFTSINTTKYYSPLDLYLMGLADKAQVPAMLVIENPAIDPQRMPEVGITISGTARYVTVDDIIAAEGERVPGPSESQKTFKTAFIFITSPGTFTGSELYGLENVRNGWVTRFSVLTDGKGLMQVASTLQENIPANPGIIPPSVTPRPLPPSIEDGVRWLMANQQVDGSWMDLSQTTERDTAEAVLALKNFDISQQNYSLGLQWLNSDSPENMDYLSRKIKPLLDAGHDVSALLNELVVRQNPDAGWGGDSAYGSNPIDTSFALKALSSNGSNYLDEGVASKAIEYVKTIQNADGGWGGDEGGSTVEETANVLSAFNKYRKSYPLEDEISKGIALFVQRQNPDGGFGNSPSTVNDTALALLTLQELDVSRDVVNSGLNYILSNQSADGSWKESPYQTALAVNAVWKATVEPDLSVKTEDITFIPTVIKSLPTTAVISVKVANLGRTDVAQAKVALYAGTITEANKIGEQTLAFPGQSEVTTTFSVTIPDGNEHRFYVSVDPNNAVGESNEGNNTALSILKPETTYDFEVLSSDIAITPSPAVIFQDVKITAKVSNKGTMNAYNIQLKYYIDDLQSPFDIATATVDIPAGATVTNEITWRANKAGENLQVAVFADPFNTFAEASEDNNKAITNLTVNGATLPNLILSYENILITPNPANERGTANVSALVKNQGFSTAANVKVDFYKGTPGVDGVLIGSQTIPFLDAGGSSAVSIDWTNIMPSGERIIYVKVDPENYIPEIREDDNDDFATLRILSLPDLAISTNSIVFNPPAPKEGDIVSINVAVQNKGEQTPSSITVTAYEGSAVVDSQTIASIPGNSQSSVSFIYDTKGEKGAHQITVVADSDNTIIEQSEDNNKASRIFGVQDANLWLTEQYISPNGDGVKDNTQFFFRLATPQTVKVLIVNGKGETVKTFSGGDLDNIANGSIIWDGLNNDGTVVNDGQYQIQIVHSNNAKLGSLLVTVDNNRSQFTDAMGTKYFFNSAITHKMPEVGYGEWMWLPDESGILIHVPRFTIPAYSPGLYLVSPDGMDIRQIISESDSNFISEWRLSPSGDKIAFSMERHDLTSGGISRDLLITDNFGSSSILLESVPTDNRLIGNIRDIDWDPTGEYILYQYHSNSSGSDTETRLIKQDGTQKRKLDSGVISPHCGGWSPDESKVLCTVGKSIRVYDIVSESMKEAYTSGSSVPIPFLDDDVTWLNNQRIVLIEQVQYKDSNLLLIDTTQDGHTVKLADSSFLQGIGFFSIDNLISPDHQHIAFASSQNGTVYLTIADSIGNSYVLKEVNAIDASYQRQCAVSINESIRWSPDGGRLAFVQICSGWTWYRTVIDIRTKEEHTIGHGHLFLVDWLNDSISLLSYRNDYDQYWMPAEAYIINSETGEDISLNLPHDYYRCGNWENCGDFSRVPRRSDQVISPLGNFITYYKVKETQLDYLHYEVESDLWTIRSLLNLTADLHIMKERSSVLLKGAAQDLNFEGYQLEYAEASSPTVWKLVSPPSNTPIVNDVFTAWVPPYEGNFIVKLTVWDKAGNLATKVKRISWGLSSSITNLYKSTEIFSPNGDGVKDAIELHYRALEPAHLEFGISDEKDNLIRTIQKDHPSPANDYISWDGRDEGGKTVPDGKYKIKVLSYEFYVEVDSTPPRAAILLDGPKQDFDLTTRLGTLNLYAGIIGHAHDKNLKSWAIEYGEGDNPGEWFEYVKGYEALVGKDEQGDEILDPIKDIVIRTVDEADIEWLVGKKLRITAEDHAGNRSTVVTDFLKEEIILLKHRWSDSSGEQFEILNLAEPDTMHPSLALPLLHSFEGVETINLPIADLSLQYWNGSQWVDGLSVTNPASGEIRLDWNNTGQEKTVAVRMKAIDILGQEHYSNVVLIEQVFDIDTCSMWSQDYLFEGIKSLKLQARSAQDSYYSQWTDYKVFDSDKGDLVPTGTFRLVLPEVKSGMSYYIRMTGIGASGKYYESPVKSYPPECTSEPPAPVFSFTLKVSYNETDCGLLSDGKTTLSTELTGLSGNALFKTLSYYLEKPEGLQLLRQFDLSKEGWGGVIVDTLPMHQGGYPVKASFTYIDLKDNAVRELSAANTMIVDRVLPSAQISYPGKTMLLCPITVTDSKGSWPAISAEGLATDNAGVKRYELFYGMGENPSFWFPAMTRKEEKLVPISAERAVKGQLGIWDVDGLKETAFSLKLKVVDIAGNASCYTTNFSIDALSEITDLTVDKDLFSPNQDSVLDELKIGYQIDEYATVDVNVFGLLKKDDGSFVPDSTPIRMIVSGLHHPSGTEDVLWDGRNDSGAVVPDGLYAVTVFATDSCGNSDLKWSKVEVDNTSPAVMISYPGPSIQPGKIVEVKGTADDLHFEGYVLEVGESANPVTWTAIASGANPIKDDIIDTWNTFGLTGKWTLRLTATDTAGNRSAATVVIDFSATPGSSNLIKDLAIVPRLFSPNGDGKLDTTTVNYGLTDSCQVRIDMFDSVGALKKTFTTNTPSAGSYTFVWDGKDNGGVPVSDGAYTVKLHVILAATASLTQDEALTVIVDSTPPTIAIKQPLNGSYFKDSLVLNGTISDPNILDYAVTYTGASGAVLLEHGSQSREDYTFGIVNDIPEGSYTLTVKAKDLAENTNETISVFTVDKTAPKVVLNTPKDGESYGADKNIVTITGSITEANLDTYSLRYGSGDNPSQWTELLGGTTIPPSPQLSSWKVGKSDGVPDGLYILSLFTKDKAGWTGEAKVKVSIDNTLPEAAITLPVNGTYVKGSVEIRGTAYDTNLNKYIIDISEGQCSSAFKWAVVKTSATSVKEGPLAVMQAPADGDYCVRLTATDKSGNRSEAKTQIKVDTQPPSAPALSGRVENKTSINLNWTQNTEGDLAGYDLYRDGVKITTSLIKGITYFDQNLKEGVYTYIVKAVDLAGNESEPSTELKLRADMTGPDAKIRSPQDGSKVNGLLDIKGTAYSSDDFKQYRVSIAQGSDPSTWGLIRTSPVPISYGTLTQWDTTGLKGLYSIKLETEDLTGNVNTHQISVTVDDVPPAAPVIMSAADNGSNVTIIWNATAENDLAGYLLFRNDRLANAASGTGIGDLRSYLISCTAYIDKSLPDGEFIYYVVAVDKAGNMSDPSNTVEITIDTHPPTATIIEPVNGTKFDNKILINAESSDTDIASVQFQYKKAQDAEWTDLGHAVAAQPYATYLDPGSLGLIFGDYQLRAVATDRSGKTDPSTSYIAVNYTDLAAPSAPGSLKSLTYGKDVTLTWSANTEADLDGYNIYRTSGSTKAKINAAIVKEATYQDIGLSDGTCSYEVTAVDIYKNESKASNSVYAKVYAPLITQPYTPTPQKALRIDGSNAEANSAVEFSIQDASDSVLLVTTSSDAAGVFSGDVSLSLGEDRITAKATDAAGNTSRASDMIVVVYNEPPSAPTGLKASVKDHDAALTWNPNSESDLAGYNLFRDGAKLNTPVEITSGNVTASSSYYNNPPSYALDSNQSTYWMSSPSYGAFAPQWWEIDLPSPELINRFEISWSNDSYSAKDFEIRVWSGYTWITQTKVAGNAVKDNAFDFKPSYRTDRIRVYISDTNDKSSYRQVAISEVRILRDNLITQPSYDDPNLHDGAYDYEVTAVDYYGFESGPSEEIKVTVGDVTPPAAPVGVTATASGSNVNLTWTANSETDLAGYNVYRNGPQGWVKINASLIPVNTYIDGNLLNGTYAYRVTAVDAVGNESGPSNEAAASVSVALLPAPLNLRATSVPEGNALNLAWEYTGELAAGYNLYRSATSGGPYVKINSSLINRLSYLDLGLINGTAYYFVVTALDFIGNESVHSNEATGVPSDGTPPSSPDIFFPTTQGETIVLYRDGTDISGMAEPASVIELFKDGVSAGKTLASEEGIVQSFTIEGGVYSASISPDGKTLAYEHNGSIWLRTLSSSDNIQIIPKGYSPVWSPDGRKLAYTAFYNDNRNYRIGIYDIESGLITFLTDDISTDEDSPSWSSDSSKLAFMSSKGGSWNIWVKDLLSESTTKVTDGFRPYYPKISPDGKKIAYYRDFNDLCVFDIPAGSTVLVETDTDGYYFAWSPDSKKVAFVFYRNDDSDLFVFDLETESRKQITASPAIDSSPVWSPNGQSLLFKRWENNSYSIRVASSGDLDHDSVLKQNISNINYLTWVKSRGIAYLDQNSLNIICLEGCFSFKDVQLDLGQNLFYATSADSSGNVSLPSGEIAVIFDSSLMPDVSITADDIFIYPPYPNVGEDVSITMTVQNKGRVEVRDVDVDIYLLDTSGSLGLLKSAKIPFIALDSAEVISVTWSSGSKAGTNTLFAVVDPGAKISELSETNNLASKEIFVISQEGISMTTTLDSDKYQVDQDLNIQINLKNSGIEKDVVIDTTIEDIDGHVVASLNSVSTHLSHASQQNFSLLWNTGSTYAGIYKAHFRLKDASGVLAESVTLFVIQPDIRIDASLTADKVGYGPGENVSLGATVKNIGKNYIIPELTVKMKIVDTTNAILFSEEKKLTSILPGATNALYFSWNTGLTPPGGFAASMDILVGSEVVSTKSVSFTVSPTVIIAGDISITPSVVIFGNNARISYTVRNMGNERLDGLPVKVLVIDPESQAVMDVKEEAVDLGIDEAQNGQFTLTTQGYGLKIYKAALQYTYGENTKSIANAAFTVKDGTPPSITLISPVSGSYFGTQVSIVVSVSDDASGVDRVEYQIDGGPWKTLPVSDLSAGKYGTTWSPIKAEEGSHTVSFRAADKAGNISLPIQATCIIDLTQPVVSSISPLPGSYYRSKFDVGVTVTDSGSGAERVEYILDGGAWRPLPLSDSSSGRYSTTWSPLLADEGTHTIDFRVYDKAGNVSEPSSTTVEIEVLFGTVSALPDPVYQGKDQDLTYTITTAADENIIGLNVKVLIVDADTEETKQTFESEADIPMNTTVTGNFVYSTLNLSPRSYRAVLTASSAGMTQTKILAISVFEVKPSLEITKKIADVKNALVWLNYTCVDNVSQPDCTNRTLIENALEEAGVNYYVVLDKKDFETELRNPYYTDFMILGDFNPIEDHFSEELREQVHAGGGLISSLFNRQNLNETLFGIKFRGSIPGSAFPVELIDSEISAKGSFQSFGEAWDVEVTSGTANIWGWIAETTSKDVIKHPGIIKNEYGKGKVLYYAFDLGLSSADYGHFAELLKTSLKHTHTPRGVTRFHPNQLVPIGLKIRSLGSPFDLKIGETYPSVIKLYEPAAGAWVTNNPWVINYTLKPEETKDFLFYAFAPDEAGAYTSQTEVGYMETGGYTFYQSLSVDFDVAENAAEMTDDLITALNALTLSGQDKAKVDNALINMNNVRGRQILTDKDMEMNIRDILQAIDSLLFVAGVDVSDIRSMMDELLMTWEGAYYFERK